MGFIFRKEKPSKATGEHMIVGIVLDNNLKRSGMSFGLLTQIIALISIMPLCGLWQNTMISIHYLLPTRLVLRLQK